MRRLFLLLLTLSASAFANVTCTNSGSDFAALQAALTAGGSFTVTGTCNLGASTLQAPGGNTMAASGTAQFNYTGTSYALSLNGNTGTINGIIFNGGGIVTSQNNHFTPQSGWTITSNTFQNITNQKDAIQSNGYWSGFNISFNAFNTISSVPFAFVTGATNVENGFGNYDCNYPTPNANTCGGGGIDNENGMDTTTINNNTFNFTLGDAIRIAYNWTLSAGLYQVASGNSISYNTFKNIHRIAFESQGFTGPGATIGPVQYAQAGNITGLLIKGNFSSQELAPYLDNFAYSIPIGAPFPVVVNNTGIAQFAGPHGYCFENAFMSASTFQGNVCSTNSGSNWSVFFMTGPSQGPGSSPGLVTYQNNILWGTGTYYSREPNSSPGGTVSVINSIQGSACPLPTSCQTSTLATGSSAITQSGGNATMATWATGQLSILNYLWFLDGSAVPITQQEISTPNAAFTSTGQWLYSTTIPTGSLASGTHTLVGVAIDVSGASKSTTQSFTVGGGSFPNTSFSTTSVNFGNHTVSTTSSNTTVVLTNTGSATLTISGITLTGTNSGDFALPTGTCGSSLTAGSSCNILVNFTAGATGARSANISVADNAAGSPQLIALSGTGISSGAGCAGSILPNCNFLTGTQSPWLFAGGGGAATLAVDSTGACGVLSGHIAATSAPAPGNNIELYQGGLSFGSNGQVYNVSFDASTNRAQTINVLGIQDGSPFATFLTPAYVPLLTAGCAHYNTTMTVINSPGSGNGRFTIQADGMLASDRVDITNVNVSPSTGAPGATLSPASIAFGGIGFGTTSAPLSTTLSNPGSATLVISGITITGSGASSFSQTNTCGSSLAAGTSCIISVKFTPASKASFSALVSVADNASGSPQTVGLSGTGTEVGNIVFPADGISHGSLAVAFTTVTTSTNARIRYGSAPCASGTGGTIQTNYQDIIASNFNQYPIGGLAPLTPYYVCPEVSKDGGATWSTGAQGIVTTAPLPSPHPSRPIAPIGVDTAYPDTSSYATLSVNNACSNTDFGTAYSTAVTNWASHGTIIQVAAGGICNAGPYIFAGVPPDQHTWQPSDVNTSTSQITWTAHGFSEMDRVIFGRSYATLTTYPASTSCDVGYGTIIPGGIVTGQLYPVHVVDANHFQVYCLPPTPIDPLAAPVTPTLMTFTTQGSSSTGGFYAVPLMNIGTASAPIWRRRMPDGVTPTPEIIVRPDVADNQLPPENSQVTPDWLPNMFKFTDPSSNVTLDKSLHPFIVFGASDPNQEIIAGPYRIMGAEITTQPYAASAHTSDPWYYGHVFVTYPATDQIVCDRCYYHMPGTPDREEIGMAWDGSNLAWKASLSDNLTYFFPANTGLALAQTNTTHFTIAAGTAYAGVATIPLASTETVTLSGSGTGRVRAYFDLVNANALTVAVPSGLTATCAPATCVSAVSLTPNLGVCSPTFNSTTTESAADSWPKTSRGEVTVAQIGCADVASGSITTAGSANPSPSLWSPEGDIHMLGGIGPGPWLNEYSSSIGAGIQWFHDDSGGVSYRGNLTYYRNYFHDDPKWLHGSPTSDGMYYYGRELLELKGGQYFDFRGNVMDTTWQEDSPVGDFMTLTPFNGARITDVNIQYNTFAHGPAWLQGPFIVCNAGPEPCGRPSVRINNSDNLTYDINGFLWDAYNPNGTGNAAGTGWGNELGDNEDLVMNHLMTMPNNGRLPWFFSLSGNFMEGWQFTNSLIWYSGVPGQSNTAFGDGTGGGSSPAGCAGLLDINYVNCFATQGIGHTLYNFGRNLVSGGYTDTSVPSGQPTTAAMGAALTGTTQSYLATGTVAGTVAAIKWVNPSSDNIANYHLRYDSPYIAGNQPFSKRSNLGPDVDMIEAQQGKVYLQSASPVTNAGFTINYKAPDAGACHVLYSTTNALSTIPATNSASGGRVDDSGGARQRNTAVSSLSGRTVYYYWVMCAGNAVMSQRTGTIKTH